MVVELGFGGEGCTASGAQSLNSNKIHSNLVKTLVRVGHFVTLIPNCDVEALGLIIHQVFVNLIYPCFIDFLIAAIGRI